MPCELSIAEIGTSSWLCAGSLSGKEIESEMTVTSSSKESVAVLLDEGPTEVEDETAGELVGR